MALITRSATTADIAEVMDLWIDAGAMPTHTDDVPAVERLVAFDPGAMIVAIDGEKIVGTIIGGWDGWRGAIYRLAVAPAYRRQGLGLRLVHEAEDRLHSLGAARIQAVTNEDDEESYAFAEACEGWEHQEGRYKWVNG